MPSMQAWATCVPPGLSRKTTGWPFCSSAREGKCARAAVGSKTALAARSVGVAAVSSGMGATFSSWGECGTRERLYYAMRGGTDSPQSRRGREGSQRGEQRSTWSLTEDDGEHGD